MKKCLACKEPLPADAHWRRRYCTNKRCRSRAYRQREKKKVDKQLRTLKRGVSTRATVQSECDGSFVVSCPCGHRLRIEVRHANEDGLTAPAGSVVAEATTVPLADAASVTARPERAPASESGQPSLCQEAPPQVSVAPPQGMPTAPPTSSVGSPEGVPRSTSEATETGSHAPKNEEAQDPTPPLATGAQVSAPEEPAPAAPAPASTFRTYELYAEHRGVPLLLDDALVFDGSRWQLRPGVRLQLGERPEDGFGLAGSPGRWRDAYGAQSPSRFGHGERWAVMYVVERRRQRLGVVVPVEMLQTLLGTEWRQLVSVAE